MSSLYGYAPPLHGYVPPLYGYMPPYTGFGYAPPLHGYVPPLYGYMPPYTGFGYAPPLHGYVPPLYGYMPPYTGICPLIRVLCPFIWVCAAVKGTVFEIYESEFGIEDKQITGRVAITVFLLACFKSYSMHIFFITIA